MQIVQTPKLIVILYESNFISQNFRLIYTDGSTHPKDLDTTYMGDSVGHWEGDTLVVDTIGFNDRTWLDAAGHQHGEGGQLLRARDMPLLARLLEAHADDVGDLRRPGGGRRRRRLAAGAGWSED